MTLPFLSSLTGNHTKATRRKKKKGRKEGRKKERKEGRKEERKEGRKKGRKEGRKKENERERKESFVIDVNSLEKISRGNCLSNNFKEMTS